jgi:hypothetical protein
MSFSSALANLETTTRLPSVFGVPARLNGIPVMVTVTPIELLQPWSAGGSQNLPTCEVALARVEWETIFAGKLGEMKFILPDQVVRVHKIVGELLSSEIRLQCGPVDK